MCSRSTEFFNAIRTAGGVPIDERIHVLSAISKHKIAFSECAASYNLYGVDATAVVFDETLWAMMNHGKEILVNVEALGALVSLAIQPSTL